MAQTRRAPHDKARIAARTRARDRTSGEGDDGPRRAAARTAGHEQVGRGRASITAAPPSGTGLEREACPPYNARIAARARD